MTTNSSGPLCAALRWLSANWSTVMDGPSAPKGGSPWDVPGALRPSVSARAGRGRPPAGGGLRAQVLHECQDGPLGGHFGRAKTRSLVHSIGSWVGQGVDVAEHVSLCQTCQRTKGDHGGPRGLLHQLPLPFRRGGMIRVGWIAGLPTTAAGFDMTQNHVDLSGRVHAVPTSATATAADAATIIRDMCLRSCAGFPNVLMVDRDAKFTSHVFRAFAKSMGSCLIVGSAYRNNTNAKVERANGIVIAARPAARRVAARPAASESPAAPTPHLILAPPHLTRRRRRPSWHPHGSRSRPLLRPRRERPSSGGRYATYGRPT